MSKGFFLQNLFYSKVFWCIDGSLSSKVMNTEDVGLPCWRFADIEVIVKLSF